MTDGSSAVDKGAFSAIVVMDMVTTMITPPLLKWAMKSDGGVATSDIRRSRSVAGQMHLHMALATLEVTEGNSAATLSPPFFAFLTDGRHHRQLQPLLAPQAVNTFALPREMVRSDVFSLKGIHYKMRVITHSVIKKASMRGRKNELSRLQRTQSTEDQ